MNAAVKEYWNSGLAHINTLPLLFLKQKIKLRFSPKFPEEFLLCHFCDLELDLHGSEGWKEQFCCGGLNYCNKWTKIMTLQLDSFKLVTDMTFNIIWGNTSKWLMLQL